MPTSGDVADWTGISHGPRRATARRHPAVDRGEGGRVRPEGLAVAGDVRAGLLRHRDDGHGRTAVRHRPLRDGAVFGDAPAGRPDDRGRPGVAEDGTGPATGV